MDSKLTLKLDQLVIEKAKDYAERQGVSLSRMVERYFLGLTQSAPRNDIHPTGLVAELAGLLAGSEAIDKDEYAEYLTKKYS
jgi:hypothetical protein